MCFTIMAAEFAYNSFVNSGFTNPRSFSVDSYNSLLEDISYGEKRWYNESQPLLQQFYDNGHNVFDGSHLEYHQPIVNEQIISQISQYMSHEKISVGKPETNSISCHPHENESIKIENQNSYNCCFYRKELIKTEDSPTLLNQTFKLPSNYYEGTYPLNVQIPDIVPSIDIDVLSESQKFSKNGNEIKEYTCLLSNQSGNEASAIEDFYLPISPPAESSMDYNQLSDSNIYQTSAKKSIVTESSHSCKSGSTTDQEAHLKLQNSLGSNFNSIPNMKPSLLIMEPITNRRLNSLSSLNSKCYSNAIDPSSPVINDPDNNIIKDLNPSRYNRSANVSTKLEILYSRKKMSSENLRTSQDLVLSSHQAGNPEGSEFQKSNLITHHVPQNNFDGQRVSDSGDNLLYCDKSGRSKNSISLGNKHTKNISGTIQSSYIDAVAYTKHRGLNSRTLSRDRFATMEDLEILLQTVSKFNSSGYKEVYPDSTIDVNIFVVGLDNCAAIRLVETFARRKFSETDFPNEVFGMNLKIIGITLKIKIWHLQNFESFFSLRSFPESSRNVLIMLYDVTLCTAEYDIRRKIEYLKLTGLPILLVGNTSKMKTAGETKSNDKKKRLIYYENGELIRDIYKLSLFLECSIESFEDVDRLFITAIDLAFRCRL